MVDADSDGEVEFEGDEELQKKSQEFFKSLESKLYDMGVKLISETEIEKFFPSIGAGSFGKVYKGKYCNELIAIKKILLKEDNFDDEELTTKALYDITNEIKSVAYVKHDRIPVFHGLWKYKGKYNLIFEFCAGKNLKDAYPKLTEKQKLEVILQLSEILHILHTKHLIHRDIKPANIMIDENFKLKLIDFGVSKISERSRTFTGDPAGTTRFMAPDYFQIDEYTESDKPINISSKTDIWSTGCLMSEIFSGVVPWMNKVKNEMALRRKLMDKVEFPIPEEIVDCDIVAIIRKCLNVNPGERINAEELMRLVKEKLLKYN